MDANELVQPIVVHSEEYTDAVCAVACASIMQMELYRLSDKYFEAWKEYLSGSFTKTVRRAKPSKMEKLPRPMAQARVGTAFAMAGNPVRYKDMPRSIAKLQVQGTDFERKKNWAIWDYRSSGPLVVINGSLEMSGGKCGAQAAHAAMSWKRKNPLSEFRGLRVFIIDDADRFQVYAKLSSCVIEDAGRTEVEPGSVTAVAL
jgi:hypothetical protein